VSTRREHFREAERLARAVETGVAELSKIMEKLTVPDIGIATQQLQLTAQLAQVHATLATVLPAASPEG